MPRPTANHLLLLSVWLCELPSDRLTHYECRNAKLYQEKVAGYLLILKEKRPDNLSEFDTSQIKEIYSLIMSFFPESSQKKLRNSFKAAKSRHNSGARSAWLKKPTLKRITAYKEQVMGEPAASVDEVVNHILDKE